MDSNSIVSKITALRERNREVFLRFGRPIGLTVHCIVHKFIGQRDENVTCYTLFYLY